MTIAELYNSSENHSDYVFQGLQIRCIKPAPGGNYELSLASGLSQRGTITITRPPFNNVYKATRASAPP